MATAAGFIGGNASSTSSSSWIHFKVRKNNNNNKTTPNRMTLSCSSSSLVDPYKTLRIRPDASESEVKKAFRQLALQYHPDVCRGTNCGVQFQTINEAYDVVMSSLRRESAADEREMMMYDDVGENEPMRGMDDPDWELWEEWMGWEGAGIRDYTSHVNPYI